MATLTGGPDFAINMAAPIIPGLFDYDEHTESPTELRFFDVGGDFTSLRGHFTFSHGQLSGGTLNTVEVDDHNAGVQILITGLTTPAKQLFDLIVSGQVEAAKALVLVNNDSLTGTALKDNINGYAGADTIIGGGNNDVLIGGAGNDVMNGGAGNDVLNGGLDADRMAGSAGNDRLRGNGGLDSMNGGDGVDQFIFDSPGSATNFDKISDFHAGVDQIVLDDAFFAGIGASFHNGHLDAAAFRIIGQAGGPEDRILYNAGTGRIYFDEDGTGQQHAPVLFAQIGLHLALSAGDFLMI